MTQRPAVALIEEATHLLRSASAATIATYYAGAIPFVLGFLYFWADMSRSPFANQHRAEAALLMTALFLWMKLCQSLFARRLRAQAASEADPAWSFRDIGRILLVQAIVQPSGLFMIPIALVLTVPFVSVWAFYQNVTILGAWSDGSIVKRAWRHATLWQMQNHFSFLILMLFGCGVFVNWSVVSLAVPYLLKTLLGIETAFSRSPFAMLNTTFFMAMIGLTYLCVDPILKTVCVLRLFYGESVESGEDLKATLKQFAAKARGAAALLALFILMSAGFSVAAQSVPAPELDRKIDEVIHQTKYAWRMPRVGASEDSQKGFLSTFIEDVTGMIERNLSRAARWIESWFESDSKPHPNTGGFGVFDATGSSILLYVLLAVVLCLVAIFIIRVRRQRAPVTSIKAHAIASAPDVSDESIGADQLPEGEWVALAQGFLERQEFRLAMRAFYLASLAHLARRNLITIARFKSNREYENELRRRGHAFPDLPDLFFENVSSFERVWYGMHEANPESVHEFAANVQRIAANAAAQTS